MNLESVVCVGGIRVEKGRKNAQTPRPLRPGLWSVVGFDLFAFGLPVTLTFLYTMPDNRVGIKQTRGLSKASSAGAGGH